MRVFAILALALVSNIAPALGVSLRCVPEGRPYCCKDSVGSLSDASVKLGIQCSKAGIGPKPKCPKSQPTKLCCAKNAIDLLGLHAVTLCQLPGGLLGDLQGLGSLSTLGGIFGGGIPGIGGGIPGIGGGSGIPGIGGRDIEEES